MCVPTKMAEFDGPRLTAFEPSLETGGRPVRVGITAGAVGGNSPEGYGKLVDAPPPQHESGDWRRARRPPRRCAFPVIGSCHLTVEHCGPNPPRPCQAREMADEYRRNRADPNEGADTGRSDGGLRPVTFYRVNDRSRDVVW